MIVEPERSGSTDIVGYVEVWPCDQRRDGSSDLNLLCFCASLIGFVDRPTRRAPHGTESARGLLV